MIDLKIIESGSAGNSYLVSDGETKILIEAGVRPAVVRQAVNWDMSRISACLITHEHADHSKYAAKLADDYGMRIAASEGTLDKLGIVGYPIDSFSTCRIGSLRILPFESRHDAEEPLNFLIASSNGGKLVFITDSAYCKYRFKGLTQIAIEANYSQEIINARIARGEITEADKPRTILNHMSLENAIKFIMAQDLTDVEKIYLLHMSKDNADKDAFVARVKEATGKEVCHA